MEPGKSFCVIRKYYNAFDGFGVDLNVGDRFIVLFKGENMNKKTYSLREVCQIIGTTRSALHGYDKVGLLHPSEKRGSGAYWFYDEKAIAKLVAIELLSSAGYSRLKIKEMLGSSHLEVHLREAANRLEEERKRIVAKICLFEMLTRVCQTPSSNDDASFSFSAQIERCISFLSSFSYETQADIQMVSSEVLLPAFQKQRQ